MTPELSHELAVFVRIVNEWIGYVLFWAAVALVNHWWEYNGHYDRRDK